MPKYIQVTFTANTSRYYSSGENKKYTYLSRVELEAGDTVVVDTTNGLALAIVAGILEQLPRSAKVENVKEVVCKIDTAEFQKRKETAERVKELRSEMNKRVVELQSAESYRMFADKDDALKTLLDEFDALTK